MGLKADAIDVEIGVEIRCQFIILARKDELTPDYERRVSGTDSKCSDIISRKG